MKAVYLKDKTGNKIVTTPYYRVGDLFLTTIATNPSNYLGGKWELFGPGRCLVCVDTSQTEFNLVKKTGGSKTVSLTKSNLPNYDLIGLKYSNNWPMTLDGGTLGNGYKLVYEYQNYNAGQVNSFKINSGGGNEAHNNLQPYITCYVWIRTA